MFESNNYRLARKLVLCHEKRMAEFGRPINTANVSFWAQAERPLHGREDLLEDVPIPPVTLRDPYLFSGDFGLAIRRQ
jgi:hypothetical protein